MKRQESAGQDIAVVYMTAGSIGEATAIGRALVEERLVACVNILEGMKSIYRWEGQIEEAQECVIIAKTRRDLVAACKERILELHGYECPCVVSWPLSEGNPAFLEWVVQQTAILGEDE